METIFDHNLTKKEKECFCWEERYMLTHKSIDSILYYFGMLFWYRDDMEKVKYYGNQIKDYNTRNDFWRTVNHPW